MLRFALAMLLIAAGPTIAYAQTLDSGSGEQASQDVERAPPPSDQDVTSPGHKARSVQRKPVCQTRDRDQTNCMQPPPKPQ